MSQSLGEEEKTRQKLTAALNPRERKDSLDGRSKNRKILLEDLRGDVSGSVGSIKEDGTDVVSCDERDL